MNLFIELVSIVAEGLKQMTAKELTITLAAATVVAGMCWALCNYYVLFWNKTFRLTATHQGLAILASVLAFCFVLAFSGMVFLKQIALAKIVSWRAGLEANAEWQGNTFREAFYGVRDLGLEPNFSQFKTPDNGGKLVPLNHKDSQLKAASIYANNACVNFDETHPFLSRIIWSSAKVPQELIKNDIQQWFNAGKGIYPFQNAVDLASNKIRDDLAAQTPRIVKLGRIAIAVLFFFVIMIPFGLIGYAAYTDIKVRV